MSILGSCVIGGLLLMAVSVSSGMQAQALPGQIALKSVDATGPSAVAEPLTDARTGSLFSGLTDAQVRDMLRTQPKSAAALAAQEGAPSAPVDSR